MMRILALGLLAVSAPVTGEIRSSTPTSFQVERHAVVAASPAAIFARIGRIEDWWDPAHSYSGKAANLRIELRPGGCFCERLDNGGGVEHLHVVYVDPDRGVRLHGGLGPLQSEAVAGTLSWSWRKVPGGTELIQTYKVSGTARVGLQALAAPVDQVLGAQFDRLVAQLSLPR